MGRLLLLLPHRLDCFRDKRWIKSARGIEQIAAAVRVGKVYKHFTGLIQLQIRRITRPHRQLLDGLLSRETLDGSVISREIGHEEMGIYVGSREVDSAAGFHVIRITIVYVRWLVVLRIEIRPVKIIVRRIEHVHDLIPLKSAELQVLLRYVSDKHIHSSFCKQRKQVAGQYLYPSLHKRLHMASQVRSTGGAGREG